MKQKTYTLKTKDIKREKFVVDANSQILGRLATRIAFVLRGKHKPIFSMHADAGDFVTVFNAEKIRVTGNKLKEKIYFTHSLYCRGDKQLTMEEKMRRDPRKVIQLAVAGMLPHNTLGKEMLKKLTIIVGATEETGKELKI